MRITRLAMVVSAVCAIALAPALAFHDGGVAHCNGCHTMHNSQNNASMNYNADGSGAGTPPGQGFPNLLLWQNKNDLCLSCHAGYNSYHVWANDVLDPGQEHGAGNFVFLEEDNINDGHAGGEIGCSDDTYDNQIDCEANGGVWGLLNPIPGTSAGHSLASGIKGTVSDGILLTAPGGSFDSRGLACTSCHDPHGNQGYRLTYVNGQTMNSDFNAPILFQASIEATGIGLFGGGANESNSNHAAYNAGYSNWCGTCHGDFHDPANADYIHPTGVNAVLNGQSDAYNKYEGTADCIANPPLGGLPCGSGLQADAYLAAVPFERGTGSVMDTADTSGPMGDDNVACVTCHRAHATSAPDSGRWDFNVTGLAEDGHESGSYPIPNPYGDPTQRSLCNKCHSKDEFDALVDFTP